MRSAGRGRPSRKGCEARAATADAPPDNRGEQNRLRKQAAGTDTQRRVPPGVKPKLASKAARAFRFRARRRLVPLHAGTWLAWLPSLHSQAQPPHRAPAEAHKARPPAASGLEPGSHLQLFPREPGPQARNRLLHFEQSKLFSTRNRDQQTPRGSRQPLQQGIT